MRERLSRIWIAAFNILLQIRENKAFTRYSHANHIDKMRCVYEVDCSGFVNHILAENYRNALKEIQEFSETLREFPKPEAFQPWPLHYMLFFQSQHTKKYWQPIQNALELRPGDIIAYYSPKKNLSSERGQHIMIVSGPVQSKKEISWIWVPIFDSTKMPHGHQDIRGKEGGIGTGIIGLELDDAKAPKRLKWFEMSKFTLKRTIKMARVIEKI